MPWNGPSRDYSRGPAQDFQLEQGARDDSLAQAMKQAELAQSGGRDLRAQLERLDATQTSSEAGRARLAMTPGVSRGGAVNMRSTANSPVMTNSAQSFSQFGQDYSYDPIVAGETEGTARAAGEVAGDRTRYDALQRIPGVSQRDARRIVYGRSGVLDEPDASDPNDMHTALAAYLQDPSIERAAHAVQVGASPGQFPSSVMFKHDNRTLTRPADAPVQGTPEYYDMLQKDEDIRTRGAEQRYRANADYRTSMAPAGGRPMTGRQSIITKNQQADDLMQQFDGDRATAESSPEAQSLGLSSTDLFLAEGRYRKVQTGQVVGVEKSGMAANADSARSMVRGARVPRLGTAQDRSAAWDEAFNQQLQQGKSLDAIHKSLGRRP